jgi:hypothetical protein
MYKDMYFHCFDFEKYNKNGKIDVDFFLQDYKNRRWFLHHYRDQKYQALDNVLKPLCRDVFVKSQPVSLFTALFATCVQDGGNGQVIRTRHIVRQDRNLEKVMERKDSAPCAVGVYLRLTQYLGNTFVKKSSLDLSEKLRLVSSRHLFCPGAYVNEA